MDPAIEQRYPEVRAGGFTRVDGTVQFYVRVRAILSSLGDAPVVLDFGAGRSVTSQEGAAVHRELVDLHPKAARVIGVDVDRSVRENPTVDESHVIAPGARLPLEDGSIDLVLADHTFEHITDPAPVAAELGRVVRAGGWICARTPNRKGYIALAARAVPNGLHARVLRRLQADREDRDVFPTAYRLNTRNDITTYFPADRFEQIIYGWEPEPAYAASKMIVVDTFRLIHRLTPERLMPTLHIFLRRLSPTASDHR